MPRKVTPTYVLLNQVTLAAATSSITFSGIPQNYADLVLVSCNVTDDTFQQYRLRFNNDSGANYSTMRLNATGSSYSSGGGGGEVELTIYNAGQSTSPATITSNIMDYSALDKHKTVISRASAPARGIEANAARWGSTLPISSIYIFTPAGSFVIGSTFYLYGIVA